MDSLFETAQSSILRCANRHGYSELASISYSKLNHIAIIDDDCDTNLAGPNNNISADDDLPHGMLQRMMLCGVVSPTLFPFHKVVVDISLPRRRVLWQLFSNWQCIFFNIRTVVSALTIDSWLDIDINISQCFPKKEIGGLNSLSTR